MEYWPLGIVILGSGLSAIVMIVLMIKIQQPGVTGKSPHHRANKRSDLLAAHDHATAVERE